ncbi:MAG: extradiol ring-cleavage dioxygenase [Chloroflexota bacterium]
MAQLVEVIGVTHNPMYCRRIIDPNETNPGVLRVRDGFGEMRQTLAAAKPDVLISIGNDHLNQLFMDNMPAFMVGKAPVAAGSFTWEYASGVPPYQTSVDVPLAKGIITGGYDNGVDFSYSDEFRFDHSFTIPLAYIRPEADLSVVPIFCNVMCPPIPPAKRFFQVGQALRKVIAEYPSDARSGVLCSGHLSVELGGPRGMGSTDPGFDDWGTEIVGTGDVDRALRELTYDRFWQAGNYTAGFLTFVLLMGLVDGRPASHWEVVHSDTNSAPFFTWDLHKESGK